MKFKKRDKTTTAADAARQFDRVLTGGLIAVAAAAAALPWYVFLNPEKFGMSGRGWEALMNVPQRGGGGGEAVIPHGDDSAAIEPKDAVVDNVITATVPAIDKDIISDSSAVQQPFPGGVNFKLLHVSNGRALIEDKSGMFLVQIGSVLPDESKLISMTKVDGRWKIVTSAGELYSE
ncbi:flagellar protein [Agrobacterium cavarae]|uniref:flagellar protein n=1 Tax=Agrobacterium cavarae TaxID=2528239 RepID=UPI003D090E74